MVKALDGRDFTVGYIASGSRWVKSNLKECRSTSCWPGLDYVAGLLSAEGHESAVAAPSAVAHVAVPADAYLCLRCSAAWNQLPARWAFDSLLPPRLACRREVLECCCAQEHAGLKFSSVWA